MNSNSRNAIASIPQSRNRLENRRGKNNEVSRKVWKAVEAGSGEVRLGETERGRREASFTNRSKYLGRNNLRGCQ